MGNFTIVDTAAKMPGNVPRRIQQCLLDDATFTEMAHETLSRWFNTELSKGGETPTGMSILASIEWGPTDIYIIPVLSDYGSGLSQFLPDVPAVVFDFNDAPIYFPALRPQPLGATIKLFHELGHFVQWLWHPDWFTGKPDYDAIEMDNLVRHEQPICKDLGQPFRMRYDDEFSSASKARDYWARAYAQTQAKARAFRAWRKLASNS